jgi:hypothetical protein
MLLGCFAASGKAALYKFDDIIGKEEFVNYSGECKADCQKVEAGTPLDVPE